MTHPFTRRAFLQTLAAVAAVVQIASPPTEDDADVFSVVTYSGSKLQRFLKSHGIRPGRFAHESGYSRQFLLRLRLGRIEATRPAVMHMTVAARRITREDIRPSDLFEGAQP
jgi:hypothetical protein